MEKYALIIFRVILANLENQLQSTSEFVPKALKDLFFVFIVFTAAENMSYIHTEQ